jgi:hypothetical protein
MGYFSNGTEGEGFFELWCERCIHNRDPDDKKQCSVWMLHLAHNYDQHAEGMMELYPGFDVHGPTLKALLDELIVERPNGRGQECSMFVARDDPRAIGGISWCASLRHSQPMEDRNSGAPCLRCLAEEGVLHYADA